MHGTQEGRRFYDLRGRELGGRRRELSSRHGPAASPYLAAKLFGGPVWWQRASGPVTATDAHHYQVAAGVVASLPGTFDLLAEVAPLGERAVTVAVGRSF